MYPTLKNWGKILECSDSKKWEKVDFGENFLIYFINYYLF